MSAARNFRRKTIRHFHRAGDCHELTFSCVHRRPLLVDDAVRSILAASIDRALTAHALRLSAFVFMPEHVHLLVWPESPAEARISEFLKTLKLSCSTAVKAELRRRDDPLIEALTIRVRPGVHNFRSWQEGPGYDRNLDNPRAVRTAID